MPPAAIAGPELAAVFADPGIVKVLHGADSDVLWLQRDFGLYPVNMFDTGQAARVLEYPSFGLAYLLQHFCEFKVWSPGSVAGRGEASLPCGHHDSVSTVCAVKYLLRPLVDR